LLLADVNTYCTSLTYFYEDPYSGISVWYVVNEFEHILLMHCMVSEVSCCCTWLIMSLLIHCRCLSVASVCDMTCLL